MSPERADNCFSLHTQERTIDFEVDNPWLVLLVVRALRLFLGAHYDTLPAPTFFSHLCVRPRATPGAPGSTRADSPKQTMVWTSADQDQTLSPSKPASVEDGSARRRKQSPWDGTGGGPGGEADSDCGSTMQGGSAAAENIRYPPPPDGCAPEAGPPPPPPDYEADGADGVGDIYGEEDDGEESADRSPGGVMALFSSGGPGPIPRSGTSEAFSSSGGLSASGSAVGAGAAAGAGAGAAAAAAAETAPAPGGHQEEAPLTASQLLATKGMTKRLNLSKKLSAANKDTGPLKGKRFDLMALPMDPGQQDRRELGGSEHAEAAPSTFYSVFATCMAVVMQGVWVEPAQTARFWK